MKTESSIRPTELEIERHGESAEVILRENIEKEERRRDGESETVYVYDEYRMCVPDRDNLQAIVSAARDKWLSAARRAEYDTLAAQIRAKRDRLLLESDASMCIDRMGLEIPEGATFSSWLSFLRGLGRVLSGEWAAYRRALRDLPQQPGFPYDVEFPKAPKEE